MQAVPNKMEASMKRLAFGMILALLGCGSSGSSGTALCLQAGQATCDKIFDCAEGMPARADNGGTKDACVAMWNTLCSASGGMCSTGTYHADKAQQCVTDTKAVACNQLDPTFGTVPLPASCSQVCGPAA
jgi:hypothetical protein